MLDIASWTGETSSKEAENGKQSCKHCDQLLVRSAAGVVDTSILYGRNKW